MHPVHLPNDVEELVQERQSRSISMILTQNNLAVGLRMIVDAVKCRNWISDASILAFLENGLPKELDLALTNGVIGHGENFTCTLEP